MADRQIAQEAMDGSPSTVELAGGTRIKFQLGPVQEVGVNGCQIEDVLEVLERRLDGFQRGAFACEENSVALSHLRGAKAALLIRTRKRVVRGVEGRSQP